MFVDPENGNFQVKEGSPAFDIGFKNFPMDQFGVKKPSLKAIAKTPVIPKLGVSDELKKKGNKLKNRWATTWKGAIVSSLVGQEFSAYGVSKEDGGIALKKVPKDSQAAKLGLLEDDLILTVNGQKIVDETQFLKAIENAGSNAIKLLIVREQKEMPLLLN